MVLLDNKINNKIKNDLLIIDPDIVQNFDRKIAVANDIKDQNFKALKGQVKPASYNIRVGKNYIKEGESVGTLTRYQSLTIEPFEVAIIETYEKINMPKDLIARWNIRVQLAYRGLVWVGGPQVDPGYSGYLYCPIYNLSDKAVELSYQDSIATIDFVQTTKPLNNFTGFDKEVPSFEFYKSFKLKSVLTSKVQDKLDDIDTSLVNYKLSMDKKQEKMEERLHKLQTTFLTIIGALFATLSILIISMKDDSPDNKGYGYAVYLAIAISTASLLMHKNDIVPWYKKIVSIIAYSSLLIVITLIIVKLLYDFL